VALLLLGCSDPGEGGGAFVDTGPDVDTRDAVLFPDLIDDLPLETVDTLDTTPPETQVDVEVETQAIDTQPEIADTTPVETVDTAVPETVDTTQPETVSSACTYQTDCYPERLCGRWVTTGALRCSDPCAGDADCATGQICSKVPGSIQVGFCQDAPAGLGIGAGCTTDDQCRSRLCGDGACAALCLDEAHCATPGMTCHPSGDLSIGLVTSVCAADAAQTIANGQVCSPDGFNFDGAYCASGHCDLLNFDASVCAPVCKSESDCAPAQECNIVLYSPTERPDAVPYDPAFTQKTHDAVSACYSPAGSGTLPEGSVCATRGQCRSNKCLALLPDSNQSYCTSFCTSDAQCPLNMACKLEALNMSSEWLAAAGNQAPGAWSFVRICKFR